MKQELPQKTPEQPKRKSLTKSKRLSKKASSEESNQEISKASSSAVSTEGENTTVIENIALNQTEPIKQEEIKTEPTSFKLESLESGEEKLDDISLIDLSEETPAKVTPRKSNLSTLFGNIVNEVSNVEQLNDAEAPIEFADSMLLIDPKEEKVSIEEAQEKEEVVVATEPVLKSPLVENRQRLSETFSPVVDAAPAILNDSRPHIEVATIEVPKSAIKSVQNRTSTPFASKSNARLLRANTIVEDSSNDSVFINPLEKSILKGSRRKRSMSVGVVEMESSNRRVMFVSPKIMDIDKIDERMMASFISEKENSIMVQPRKRSLSVGAKSVERQSRTRKMPDFKSIHESNFNKMESIGEHMKRKAVRAKRLLTPEPKKTESKASKIPKMSTNTNAASNNEKPRFVFSSTALPPKIAPTTPKALAPKNIFNLQKPKVEDVKMIKTEPGKTQIPMFAFGTKTTSTITANRIKVEERREKNMSMYKSNHVKGTQETRQKNLSMLKGVRLNRRFELQMQQRQKKDS